jgi:YVTN family beta-propeller protein
MRTNPPSLQLGIFACLVLAGSFSPNAFGQTLKQVTKFDLPGPGGKRFDYLTIDEDDHYLLSAHLAAGQTYVIDLGTNKVIATITDTPGAEGVEYVPELKKFYTSNAHDNTIGVVDLKQMQVIKKLKTEAKPDGSTYAAPFHKCTSPMNVEKQKPLWMCRRMKSSARCTSIAKRECRSTTPWRGKSISICRTRIFSPLLIRRPIR